MPIAMEEASARDSRERMRVLYVAIDAAEKFGWIIAAAGDADKDCWYALLRKPGLGAHLGRPPLVRGKA